VKLLRRRVTPAAEAHYLTTFAFGETPLSLSLFDASVPVYVNMLKNLSHFMDKAETHAASGGPSLQTLMDASFGHGMANFTRQIQFASDGAKSGAARLAGVEPPAMPDTETTWTELKERIAKTIDFIKAFKPAQIEGTDEKEVVIKLGGNDTKLTGMQYLLGHAHPNFYFHVTTAYDILRHNGVVIGKRDYIGTP